ncbi:hypothetical protein EUX98_g3081 [Antrodiella citrinella]|uniref:Uncharacterized protein n=1 Tax=Antrodiella citrinella TaxID=2447956 RepID=A0A4S4N007_9APHY|nr:hypothetical protein EUX98_g3081 [Antrodiella citrinella]
MAAVAASKASTSASPFSALLRRSKFASHDPKISQVYASFGGDAHRGNFGLKRPIPLRGRHAHITVSEVDSRDSQTVWVNAEQPAKWARMWDEVSVYVRPKEGSSWSAQLGNKGEVAWMVDSEFAPKPRNVKTADEEERDRIRTLRLEGAKVTEGPLIEEATELGLFAPTVDVENVHAMDEAEFAKYLDKIRAMRPKFKRYLEVGDALYSAAKGRSVYEFSQTPQNTHRHFIAAQAYNKYNAPDSHAIEQRPHLNAGLTYAASSKLQYTHLRKPQPGRVINTDYSQNARKRVIVSFAGMTTELRTRHARGIDWDQLARTGVVDPAHASTFRITESELAYAPRVAEVRKSATMRGTVIFTKVIDATHHDSELSNPHRPGSLDYMTHQEAPKAPSPVFRRSETTSLPPTPAEAGAHNSAVMSTLEKYAK